MLYHIDIKATTGVTLPGDVGQVAMPWGKQVSGEAAQLLGTPELPGTVTNPRAAPRDPHSQSPGASAHLQAGLTSVDRIYSLFNNPLRLAGGILKLNHCWWCHFRGKMFGAEGAQRQRLTHELHKAAETQ